MIDIEPPCELRHRVMALALHEPTPNLPMEALVVTRQWLRSPNKDWALVLLGSPGCGKSQAAALAWMVTPGAIWIRARSVKDMTWPDRAWLRDRAKRARLTVVDEMLSESDVDFICEIVDPRGEAFYRTIMLGNGTMQAFEQRYSGRLASRLESTNARWLCDELAGPDLRTIVEPITERPSMDWIPRGLDEDDRNAFMRTAFVDGLDAARAELAAKRTRLAATRVWTDDEIKQIARRLRVGRPSADLQGNHS